MTDIEAIRKVQRSLNGMESEELGAVLSRANDLRQNGSSDIEKRVGEILFRQVLVALTPIHWVAIEDEPAGMCWEGDCYPEEGTLLTSVELEKVTCPACLALAKQWRRWDTQ